MSVRGAIRACSLSSKNRGVPPSKSGTGGSLRAALLGRHGSMRAVGTQVISVLALGLPGSLHAVTHHGCEGGNREVLVAFESEDREAVGADNGEGDDRHRVRVTPASYQDRWWLGLSDGSGTALRCRRLRLGAVPPPRPGHTDLAVDLTLVPSTAPIDTLPLTRRKAIHRNQQVTHSHVTTSMYLIPNFLLSLPTGTSVQSGRHGRATRQLGQPRPVIRPLRPLALVRWAVAACGIIRTRSGGRTR